MTTTTTDHRSLALLCALPLIWAACGDPPSSSDGEPDDVSTDTDARDTVDTDAQDAADTGNEGDTPDAAPVVPREAYAEWPQDPPEENIYHGSAQPGPGASARYIGSPCVVASPLGAGPPTLMYYAGTAADGARAIYVAGSDDGGLSFTELGIALAAGDPGAWDDEAMDTPFVAWDPTSERLLMWYMGNSLANEESAGGDDLNQAAIGLAESVDGVTWTRVGTEPVLAPVVEGWDSHFVADPSVVWDGEAFRMAYSGMRAFPAAGIGLATSPDGVTWTRVGDGPVVTPDEPWESVLSSSPGLVRVESGPNAGTWLIYYQGTDRAYAPDYNMALGLATAPSFEGPWADHPGNPLIHWPQDPAIARTESWYIGPINVHVLEVPAEASSEYPSYVMFYETAYGFGRIASATP